MASALSEGEIASQPLFDAWLAKSREIAQLREQEAELLKQAGDNLFQRGGAIVKRLAIQGQIKVAQFQLATYETPIGRELLESEIEDSVRCKATAEVLRDIKAQRAQIIQLHMRSSEEQAILADGQKELQASLALPAPPTSVTIAAAIKNQEFQLNQHIAEGRSFGQHIPDMLLQRKHDLAAGELAALVLQLEEAMQTPQT